MEKILVTGANQGIGFALSKKLAIDYNCHVYVTARSETKGMDAVEAINESIASKENSGKVEFVLLDVADDSSVSNAAETIRAKLEQESESSSSALYAIVNNAGIGFQTAMNGDILNINLYGTKRVCDAFLPLLDQSKGRIVNLGSGAGPGYAGKQSVTDKKILCSPDSEACTIDWIENHAKANERNNNNDYGLSKALVACYTGVLARMYPHITSSCVTPGYINTQMTAGWGASKTPEQGTMPILHCLFEKLDGNGYYYGSDAKRSPYHFMRNPGEPVYDGINPFL